MSTDDDGEERLLARANISHVPRIGETVALDNLRWRADEEKPFDEQRAEPTVVFVVMDVTYQADAHFTFGKVRREDAKDVRGKVSTSESSGAEYVEAEPISNKDFDVKVWLALPLGERAWPGLAREVEPTVDIETVHAALDAMGDARRVGASNEEMRRAFDEALKGKT